MEISIHPGLLALPIQVINSALDANSRLGRFHAIKAEKGSVSFTIQREDIVVRATLDMAKIVDPKLLTISKEGFAVVNGTSNAKIVLKNHSQLPIHIKFDEKKKTAKAADGQPADEIFDDSGTMIYGIIGDTGKKWRASLQSLHVPDCDLAIDVGEIKAVISGKDLQNYAKFVGAYGGKVSASTRWSDALVRLHKDENGKDQMQFVTTNGQQIGIAMFSPVASHGEFKSVITADALQDVSKYINPELDVAVHVKAGTPSTLSFVQRLTYGNGEVGSIIVRVPTSADKFYNFEGPTSRLNTATTIKLKAQALKNACDMLDVIDRVKTKTNVDVAAKQVSFHKEGEEGVIDDLSMSLVSASGNPIELDLSSRHLCMMADQAKESDEVTIHLSGRTSMALTILDDNRRVYFAPFKDS